MCDFSVYAFFCPPLDCTIQQSANIHTHSTRKFHFIYIFPVFFFNSFALAHLKPIYTHTQSHSSRAIFLVSWPNVFVHALSRTSLKWVHRRQSLCSFEQSYSFISIVCMARKTEIKAARKKMEEAQVLCSMCIDHCFCLSLSLTICTYQSACRIGGSVRFRSDNLLGTRAIITYKYVAFSLSAGNSNDARGKFTLRR